MLTPGSFPQKLDPVGKARLRSMFVNIMPNNNINFQVYITAPTISLPPVS